MAWQWERKINYYETDRMGVVHHSNYLRILEEARLEWLAENLLEYSELEAIGVIVPVIYANERFKTFLRYGETALISVKLSKYTGVKFEFSYEIRNVKTGVLCLTAETGHCFTSDALKTGREYMPISLKRKFPELHDGMLKILERDSGE